MYLDTHQEILFILRHILTPQVLCNCSAHSKMCNYTKIFEKAQLGNNIVENYAHWYKTVNFN